MNQASFLAFNIHEKDRHSFHLKQCMVFGVRDSIKMTLLELSLNRNHLNQVDSLQGLPTNFCRIYPEDRGLLAKSSTSQLTLPSLPWTDTWLPDGYSQIFRSYVIVPSGFWTMAPLRYAVKCDPFLSLGWRV